MIPQMITTSAIQSRAQLLISSAGRLVIDSQEAMERAADAAKNLKSLVKKAEDVRTTLVKPLNDEVKEVNERFKAITVPLTLTAKAIESKMLDFTQKQERIARAEAEKRRLAEEQARKDIETSKNNIETSNDSSKQPSLPLAVPTAGAVAAIAVPEITRGVMGATASVRKTWTYELIDIIALANARPDLVTVDSVKINAEIRGKGGEIPGLRIFQQESMSVR